jgi:hypothetical protein
MAVKWIGDVAKELGIDVLDAVEFLAGKQNYPMNGLLDEERVQFLKLGKASASRVESTNPMGGGPPAPEEKTGRRGRGGAAAAADKAAAEKAQNAQAPENVTAPIAPVRDKAEDRTVILQNPMQIAEQGGPSGS